MVERAHPHAPETEPSPCSMNVAETSREKVRPASGIGLLAAVALRARSSAGLGEGPVLAAGPAAHLQTEASGRAF